MTTENSTDHPVDAQSAEVRAAVGDAPPTDAASLIEANHAAVKHCFEIAAVYVPFAPDSARRMAMEAAGAHDPGGARALRRIVAAMIHRGATYGLGPLESMETLYVEAGSVLPTARLKIGLAISGGRLRGFKQEAVGEGEAMVAVFTAERLSPGEEPTPVEYKFSWAEAKQAGLTENSFWVRQPKQMLLARGGSQFINYVLPDYLSDGLASLRTPPMSMEEGRDVAEERARGANAIHNPGADDHAAASPPTGQPL